MQAHSDTLRPVPGPAVPAAIAAAAVAAAAASAAGAYPAAVLGVAIAGLVAMRTFGLLLRWEVQLTLIVLTILLIPLGRYELPGNLPFNLEPYRVLVAIVAAGWCASLLADPTMRWKPIGYFGPLCVFAIAVVGSEALNTARIDHYNVLPEVIKAVSMLASYWIVLLLAASVIKTREHLELVIKALVGGGAFVAVFALIQYRSGFNLFDHLDVIPLLDYNGNGIVRGLEDRGAGERVYASAQHPIALSAALVMLLPLGIYTGRRFGARIWWVATAVIGVAAFSTVARTGSTMLLTVLIAFMALRPREVLSLWKWSLPFIVAVHLMAPGALGGLKSAFFPSGGLIAEQQYAFSNTSSNRLADLGPGLKEWWKHPYVGYGWGTRITEPDDPKNNALILDNQWLGLLLDVGLVGALAILWLLVRSVSRLAAAARGDPTEHGWLLVALAAAISAFGVGMVTFDSFAFIQVTFLFFILIGLSVPAVRLAGSKEAAVP
jgi:hypothetical protein